MTNDELMQAARTHHAAGRAQQAEALYRQVLQANPNHAEALNLLGALAQQFGYPEQAVQLMERSVALAPDNANFLHNYAEVLRTAGQNDRAVAVYEKVLALAPSAADSLHGLGVAQEKAGRVEQALETFERAIRVAPDLPRPYMSRGALIERQGRYAEALADFERAIALKPDYALAHTARAHALLRLGRYEEGWPEYEWRWRVDKFPGRRPDPRRPLWDGSDLAGKTLLLYSEQGMGDAIQFVRYLPMAAARGGRVVLVCPPALARLFGRVPGVASVVTEPPDPATYDVQLPLMSLPHAFGTTPETVPNQVPYLTVARDLLESWERRVTARRQGPGPKVGLCWAGGRTPLPRTLSLAALAPLADAAPGVTFYSLQVGPAGAEAANPPVGMNLVNLAGDLGDFADTAAVVSALDLVISIDTAVAHLAGALGKPTWVMLTAFCDWRWMLDREDSPWYPTVRLFRATGPGAWPPVARVAAALREWAASVGAAKAD